MRTDEHLAIAATRLGALLEHGQRDLIADRDAARTCASTRDQVAAGLAALLRTAATGLDELGHPAAASSTAALSRTLGHRTTRLHGPAPTDMAIHRPATDSARAWIDVATQLEAALVQASRATTAVDVWQATIADAAALTLGLAWVDVDLGRALLWTGVPRLARAGQALLNGTDLATLRRRAQTVTTTMTGGDLPPAYHLRAPATGTVTIHHPDQIPAALVRAGEVLRASPTMTARQHRSLATSLAAIAHRLQPHLAPTCQDTPASAAERLQAALARYATTELSTAGAWQRATHLWCTQPGAEDVPTQLNHVAEVLATHPTSALADEAARAAVRALVALGEAAVDNHHGGLISQHWLVSYHRPSGLRWARLRPNSAPQDDGASAFTRDIQLSSRPRRTAGITVRDFQIGHPADKDRISSPEGLQDLARILTAHQVADASRHELITRLGPEHTAQPGTDHSARHLLGHLAAAAAASATTPDTPRSRPNTPTSNAPLGTPSLPQHRPRR